jgi:hypothetical protein
MDATRSKAGLGLICKISDGFRVLGLSIADQLLTRSCGGTGAYQLLTKLYGGMVLIIISTVKPVGARQNQNIYGLPDPPCPYLRRPVISNN